MMLDKCFLCQCTITTIDELLEHLRNTHSYDLGHDADWTPKTADIFQIVKDFVQDLRCVTCHAKSPTLKAYKHHKKKCHHGKLNVCCADFDSLQTYPGYIKFGGKLDKKLEEHKDVVEQPKDQPTRKRKHEMDQNDAEPETKKAKSWSESNHESPARSKEATVVDMKPTETFEFESPQPKTIQPAKNTHTSHQSDLEVADVMLIALLSTEELRDQVAELKQRVSFTRSSSSVAALFEYISRLEKQGKMCSKMFPLTR
jgi:hypothetical protein